MALHINPGIETVNERPTPTDFDKYLPWACGQLSVDANVIITRKVQTHYVSAVASDRSKPKTKPKAKAPTDSFSESDLLSVDDINSDFNKGLVMMDKPVYMETIYDANFNLVQLKIHRNSKIPRIIMKIIGLLIPFHKQLTSIAIDRGLYMDSMYEISQFLPTSRITDIILDGTFLIEANYHILLGQNDLKYLSLSKCKITDAVVETIASKLVYSCPASKTLSALNLSTNKITDLGVKYLAEMLRSNRHLSYLNLADNMITDEGAISIFDSLVEFPLTSAETLARNARFMTYLRQKKILVLKTVKDLQSGEFDKKNTKRKSMKPIAPPKKGKQLEKDISMAVDTKSLANIDSLYYERAEIIAEGILGPFSDPFGPDSIERRDRHTLYCFGNNTLCYLNISYNNLTYYSLKRLCEVLMTQKLLNRKPKGLINIVIEGNYMPANCHELQDIDALIGSGLDCFNAQWNSMNMKKRSSHSRNSTK